MVGESPSGIPKRPIPLLVIGPIFILAGIIGIVYHAGEIRFHWPPGSDFVMALFVRLLAIVGGAFLLQGKNWARWLVVGWLLYHVGLGAFHSPGQVVFHAGLLAVVAYFLFRPNVSAYLHRIK